MTGIEKLVTAAADEAASASERLAAFGEIVRRFQDMAYGCAYAVLGDFHMAEDAAQEAFLRAYQKLPGLRKAASFPGWLRRIVVNQCRRMGRVRRAGGPLGEGAEVACTAPQPPEAAANREMCDNVLAAVRALPQAQRMATTLFYVDGYSHKEIAEFLEVPVTTVKQRLFDSRKRLRERMTAMIDESMKSRPLPERFAEVVVQLRYVSERVNPQAEGLRVLSAEALRERSDRLRRRLAEGEPRDEVRAEAFALVREATRRALGIEHYDVQLVAAMMLDEGWIAEEAAGEGKTVTAFPAVYMAALEGRKVHVVTVNEYLACRDAELARRALEPLGVRVGVIAADMERGPRRAAYGADVTYGIGSEFIFDHLRDGLRAGRDEPVQGSRDFAIVDEADSVLLDEARVPCTITYDDGSGPREIAKMSVREYFRKYRKLAGMTGTAATAEEDFRREYGVSVAVVPTRRPVNRVDHPDRLSATAKEKLDAVAAEAADYSRRLGRPVLVGAWDPKTCQALAARLRERNVPHEVLDIWPPSGAREAAVLDGAGRRGAVTVAVGWAGRGTDIALAPEVIERHCVVPPAERLKELQVEAEELFPPGSVKCCIHCGDYDRATGCAHCFKPKVDGAFPGRGRRACREEVPCGLHVIGAEHFPERRHDGQFRSRAGVQGQPGSARFFASLEDPGLAGVVGELKAADEASAAGIIERAQRGAEERDRDIRRQCAPHGKA